MEEKKEGRGETGKEEEGGGAGGRGEGPTETPQQTPQNQLEIAYRYPNTFCEPGHVPGNTCYEPGHVLGKMDRLSSVERV